METKNLVCPKCKETVKGEWDPSREMFVGTCKCGAKFAIANPDELGGGASMFIR